MSGALYQDQPFALTKLSPEEEAKFRSWAQALPWFSEFSRQYGEAPNLDSSDYDYRGAWKAGIAPSRYQHDNGAYHWPSSLPGGQMLKAPDHPTAWMEHFMRATGQDPNALGIRDQGAAMMYMRQKGLMPSLAPQQQPQMPPALLMQ